MLLNWPGVLDPQRSDPAAARPGGQVRGEGDGDHRVRGGPGDVKWAIKLSQTAAPSYQTGPGGAHWATTRLHRPAGRTVGRLLLLPRLRRGGYQDYHYSANL